MRRRFRVAGLVALLVFALLVFAVPAVAGGNRFDPDRCQGRDLVVMEWARDPTEVDTSGERARTYENLTTAQQSVFDSGRESLDTEVSLTDSQVETADSLPRLVVSEGTVYRAQVRFSRCPLVVGVPPAMNPLLTVFLGVNRVVTGPLAPVIVVVGGVALAFRLGRMLEY
jgi:hypothetical protein